MTSAALIPCRYVVSKRVAHQRGGCKAALGAGTIRQRFLHQLGGRQVAVFFSLGEQMSDHLSLVFDVMLPGPESLNLLFQHLHLSQEARTLLCIMSVSATS